MDEDEEFKTKENVGQLEKDLPSIHAKKPNQFFQMDDFNSLENEKNNNGVVKSVTPIEDDIGPSNKGNKMMNTSDKLKDLDEGNSHKNGTHSGSDHKMIYKSPDGKSKTKNDDTPMSHSKSINAEDHHGSNAGKISAENEIIHKERKGCPKWNSKVLDVINKTLENKYYIIFMTIVTIYALFGDDFRLLLSPKSGDEIFWSFTVVALFFFALELVLASFAQKDYFLGFYFWLDLIATVSLITDIGWIYNEIVGGGDISASNASQASSLARAGRGARVGTRAGRIVRLVRLIRIVKLYKHAHKALEKEAHTDDEQISPEEFEQIQANNQEPDIPKESHVGRQLSDLTTRRVIVIVLIMMFSVPLLSLNTYREDPNSFKYGLQLIASYIPQEGAGWNAAFRTFIDESDDTRNPVVSLYANGVTYDNPDTSLGELRTIEVLVATYDGDNYVSVHDNRKNIQLGAGLGIGRTLFICLVLTVAAMWFSSTTNELVINPIESMIHKVKKIAKNPLEAAQEEENQALAMEKFLEEEEKNNKGKKKKKTKEGPYETVILENTIVKIGALLAIGFGEAGSEIIAKNMEQSGEVDPMLPGKKWVAFFGFWDIRQFTDTTEILQEEVMLFVNEIGEIVHAIVDSFAGSANKNIGDAFLLVWKLPDEDTQWNDKLNNIVVKPTVRAGQTAEMAMLSFLKCFAGINKSRNLYKYRSYPKLNERMPNYSVKMGFGLHVGWAIEGALGSDFKIDVSYLSANVKLSDELEASTKLFGTPLLMSGYVYDLMTPETKSRCRQVDTVRIPGNSGRLRLFTWDIDYNLVELEPETKNVLTGREKKLKRVKARLKRDRDKVKMWDGSIKLVNKFELDEDLSVMRKPFPSKFYDKFNDAYMDYHEGRWREAKSKLEEMEGIRGSPDGPSLSLLRVMQEHNFQAPPDWEGWRELD